MTLACPYRSLIEAIDDDERRDAVAVLLTSWLTENAQEAVWLASLRERGRSDVPPASQQELWRLYALSRLCDRLVQAASRGDRDVLSMAQVEAFMTGLGIDAIRPETYSPFHHEVVATAAAPDPRALPRIVEWHWPCLMLGSLLILRGGVSVQAGADVLASGIADASTLYWTYSRERRPTHDLAHGWGANSAWRTPFRRDYVLGDVYHFNVDAPTDLADAEPPEPDDAGLTRAERIELLTCRSFVVCSKEHGDRFPYRDRFSTPVAAGQGSPPRSLWRRLFR